MIVTIEYILPDDEYEYMCAIKGRQYLSVLQELRKRIHDQRHVDSPQYSEFYMEMLYEILNEEGVEID